MSRPELEFVEITEDDLPELTEVMVRAFDHDSRRHLGLDRGGPPGYDDGSFFRKWLFAYDQNHGLKMVSGGRIVGCVTFWILDTRHYFLGTIFVDPEHQDRGVGTKAWQHIEALFPEAISWTLETPEWSTRNHRFYEDKCGFTKVGTNPVEGETWVTWVYRKECAPSEDPEMEE